MMEPALTLAQEFILLASDGATHKWRKPMRSYLHTYAAGAVLIEMLAKEAIRIGEKGKLEVVRAGYRDDEAGQWMIRKLSGAKPATLKKWVQRLYSRSRERSELFEAVARPLIRNGDLREERHRVMLVFSAKRYVPSDASKDRIVRRIRAELLESGPVTRQTALLTMMLETGKLLKGYFSDYERNALEKRLRELQDEQDGQWKSIRQIRKAIEEMDFTGIAVAAAT